MREILREGFYRAVQVLLQGTGVPCLEVRAIGRQHVPRSGGVILASNHQSFLDPLLASVGLERRLRYLARESLFRNPAFAGLIRLLGAVEIQRESSGVGGVRLCLDLLRQGNAVLLFPEGTRTRDGHVGLVRPGISLIARRGGVPIVPVTICGAYDVWPRHRLLLQPGHVEVSYGKPIPPAQCARLKAQELAGLIRRRLVEDLQRLRRRYHRGR